MSRSPSANPAVEAEPSAGLRWTGHPLVDMGIATLVAFCEQDRPEDVTPGDLDAFAAYVERALRTASLRSHASVLFTQNVPYLQNSFKPEQKAAEAARLLRASSFATDDSDLPCVYCRRSAVRLKTPNGRAYRELIPLLTGQGIVNFAPYGAHGLPLCGLCLVALQALVLGAPSCEGRALIVSADDPAQVVELVRGWLPDLRARIQLSDASGAKVDTWKAPKTRLIQRLVELGRSGDAADTPTSFTLYHATNSGQGPRIDIHYLPAPVAGFVRRAQAQAYHAAWRLLETRAWQDAKRRAAERAPGAEEWPYWRNRLYEDLFQLPDQAARFMRFHLLRPQLDSLRVWPADEHAPLWNLTQLFLEEVLGMEQSRLQAIRALGDALAEEVAGNNDRRLFRTALQATRYVLVRRLLLQVSSRRLRRGDAPVVNFDAFLSVFETGEDLPQTDWRLAWDLVLIRLIDRLHERGWIRESAEAAEDLTEIETRLAAEAEESDELPAGAAG